MTNDTNRTEKEVRANDILKNYVKFLPSMPADTRVCLPRDTVMLLDLDTEGAKEAMEATQWDVKMRAGKNSPYELSTGGLATTSGALLIYLKDRLPDPEADSEEFVIEAPIPEYLRTDEGGAE